MWESILKEKNVSKRRIVMTGSCEYEMRGLELMLAGEGFRTARLQNEEPGERDLLVLALSAEPLLHWGRHLSRLRKLRAVYRCRILVLVPALLHRLRLPGDLIFVCSGRSSHAVLRSAIYLALAAPWGKLSVRHVPEVTQHEIRSYLLRRLLCNGNAGSEGRRRDYYQRSRMVSVSGLPNVHVMMVAGPEILSLYAPKACGRT